MVAALLKKSLNFFKPTPPTPQEVGYHSKFGGMWTDRVDAENVLNQKIARGEIDSVTAERLKFWMKNGYVIIPNAVPVEVIDQLNADINNYWETGDPRFLVQTGHGAYIPLPEADKNRALNKLLDVYVYLEAARKAGFSSEITKFLRTVFEKDILAFQNLTFWVGSTQAIHQDTAYVVCSKPLQLAASWIALENIQEGSGELMYYPGSHRYPDYMFGGQYKHWDIARDGKEDHDKFLVHLHERAKEMGLSLEKFRPKKGDALIWAADLAHGGGPITDANLTRRSYVTHYCPNDVDPHYFKFVSERRHKKIEAGKGNFYCSSHYDI